MKRKSKKRIARGSLLAAILIPVIAIIGFVYWSNKPVTVRPKVITSVQGTTASEPASKTVQTTYFTAVIPGNLQQKKRDQPAQGSSAQYEQQFWAEPGSPSLEQAADQLAITVAKIPGDGLSGVSDVQFRSRNPSRYVQVKPQWAPPSSFIFEGTDPDIYEQSVFWRHGSVYAAVVVSGSRGQPDSLEPALKAIIASWQWK